jgi:CSLREA domain-containing protein
LGSDFVLLLAAPPVQAATISVNTTLDETGNVAQCSLRDAVAAANTDTVQGGCSAGNGTDTISLPAGSFVLTVGELSLTGPTTITGAGAPSTTIDANHASRILEIGTQGAAPST